MGEKDADIMNCGFSGKRAGFGKVYFTWCNFRVSSLQTGSKDDRGSLCSIKRRYYTENGKKDLWEILDTGAKTGDGTKYVCACCGQEFTKADAGRMNEIVDRYVSGNGFDPRAVYSEMRRIKTLYWEDGRREKANFRTEEPAIVCGPYKASDLHHIKLADFSVHRIFQCQNFLIYNL